jgi:histidine triad (HIT) family protein
MAGESDCLFCKVVRGEVPAERVLETEHAVAIRDINPQAPTHVLVVPRAHHRDVGAMAQADPDAAVAVLDAAREVAAREGHGDAYRLVFNTGAAVGQSVFHVHGHVLAGRDFGWPPG